MKYLVTGSAGFIGYHVSDRLCREGKNVCGVDNLNNYYDVNLKKTRLQNLARHENFQSSIFDLTDKDSLIQFFEEEKPDVVINLAAQPGVRYSITHPEISIRNNINAYFNLLECCRLYSVRSLIYASSSSVYGNSDKIPFSVNDNVDHPVSLYAATKKSNELMSYTYHHLYKIPVTGLRFFTVYGPYGRPDMAYYKFAQNIMHDKPIDVYNNGDMERDFTYIDDVVEAIYRLTQKQIEEKYLLFNIGGEHPVNLMNFIRTLEDKIGRKVKMNFKPMQPGDVKTTYADSSGLSDYIDYKPQTRIDEGLEKFVKWFKEYYNYD